MISKKFLIFLYLFIFINNSFAIELNRIQSNVEDYNNLVKLEKFNEIPEAHSIPNVDTLFTMEINTIDQTDSIDSYFGYDFFTNRNNIEIWDNLPPAESYVLGPGDEIIINIWGDTQVNHSHIIDRQGKIFLDKVGMVALSGQTLLNAEEILINRFGTIYSTLLGNNPTSSLDVSIGELKSMNITVLGEVNQPGLYKIHPFSTLTTCIVQIGGIDKLGTLRRIEVLEKINYIKLLIFTNFSQEKIYLKISSSKMVM